jgi:putative DNA primase/helicase
MGDYARNTPVETLLQKNRAGEIPADVARLDGPRLVTASEVDKGRRLAESLIKALTGRDTVTARFMYGEFFDFVPQFKLFLSTNNKPLVRGVDHAIWRRIHFIAFPVQIPLAERDLDLGDKLMEQEAPGILRWLVQGSRDWYELGLQVPEDIKRDTMAYRVEMDVLQEFLEDRCLVYPGASVPAGQLYEAYCQWAEEGGMRDKERLKKRTFGLALSERGFQSDKTTAGLRVRLGLSLRIFE